MKRKRWNAAGHERMRMDGGGAIWRSEGLCVVYSLAGDESSGSEGVSLRHQSLVFRFGHGVAERVAQAPGVRVQ